MITTYLTRSNLLYIVFLTKNSTCSNFAEPGSLSSLGDKFKYLSNTYREADDLGKRLATPNDDDDDKTPPKERVPHSNLAIITIMPTPASRAAISFSDCHSFVDSSSSSGMTETVAM